MEYRSPFTHHIHKSNTNLLVYAFHLLSHHHTPIAFRMGDYYCSMTTILLFGVIIKLPGNSYLHWQPIHQTL